MENETNDSHDSESLTIDGEIYWALREAAASAQMDEIEYLTHLLRDHAGVEFAADEVPETFGDYLVRELEVSGTRRRENVRGVGQALYERWDPDESDGDEDCPSWELWNEAAHARAEAAAEGRSDIDPETYHETVRNSIYDAGFDGHSEFRQQVGTLVREYDQQIGN